MRQWDGEGCNAWRYEQDSKVCEMGEVTELVDTDNTGVLVMVMETVLDTLPLTCHGGEHCCSRDWPCGEGEGDCHSDHDCSGLLVCGHNNCGSQYGRTGGYWGAHDDCCTPLCTEDTPCSTAQGPCSSNDQCRGSLATCSALCLDNTEFPAHTFPNNSGIIPYSWGDM